MAQMPQTEAPPLVLSSHPAGIADEALDHGRCAGAVLGGPPGLLAAAAAEPSSSQQC